MNIIEEIKRRYITGNIMDLIDKKLYLVVFFPEKFKVTRHFRCHRRRPNIQFTRKQTINAVWVCFSIMSLLTAFIIFISNTMKKVLLLGILILSINSYAQQKDNRLDLVFEEADRNFCKDNRAEVAKLKAENKKILKDLAAILVKREAIIPKKPMRRRKQR